MTAVRSFRGLGCPQQAFGIFRSLCGAKYNACYFCCADAPFFRLTVNLSGRLPMFRHRIWSYATAPRMSDILLGFGAVFMLGVRQFYEICSACIFGAVRLRLSSPEQSALRLSIRLSLQSGLL